MAENPFSDLLLAVGKATRRRLAIELFALPLVRTLVLRPPRTSAPRALFTVMTGTNRRNGAALARGHFVLGGKTRFYARPALAWSEPAPSRRFAVLLHEFDWMHDLLAFGGARAETLAAGHMDSWLDAFGQGNAFSWAPGITARRCLNWLYAGKKMLGNDAGGDRRRRSLVMQIAYLDAIGNMAINTLSHWHSALVLTAAGVMLPGAERFLPHGLTRLQRELDRQILADGGHVCRSPEAAAIMLGDLVAVRLMLDENKIETPENLEQALKRLAPMVRFLNAADGNLACFNGGGEGRRLVARQILDHLDVSATPFSFAPHSGYHRVKSQASTLIMDTGRPPPPRYSQAAHAGALALEISTPEGRLIVNCGWSRDQPERWRQVVRSSAAHSTLVIEDTSSAQILPPGLRSALLGARLHQNGPPGAARLSMEDDLPGAPGKHTKILATHNGYLLRYGVVHQRQVRVHEGGTLIRGEDHVYRPVNAPQNIPKGTLRASLRFHLHPQVHASLVRESGQALLRLPDGSSWQFQCASGALELEPSVYLGAGPPPQRSMQIVVHHRLHPGAGIANQHNRMIWSLERVHDD